MARLTKLKNTFGEDGLPGARWAGQQDRIGRSVRHALNTIDKRVERRITRLDTRHLFDANTVWLGLKRGQLQRNYVWRFIELCNAGLSLEEIKRQAMEPEEAAIDYQI